MKCPLCGRRKGRRRCPAKDALICSHCCGTKRRVAVPCPDDCTFLVGAHAAGWQGRTTERERDQRRIGPFLAPLSDTQAQLFLASLAGLVDSASRQRDADDRLMAEAVVTLRKTADTRGKGILYDHQAEDVRAQAVVLELNEIFERRDESGAVARPREADVASALRAVEEALSATIAENAGPTAFLETAERVVSELAQATDGGDDEEQEEEPAEAPRIILPG
jgi:hypothetical protein